MDPTTCHSLTRALYDALGLLIAELDDATTGQLVLPHGDHQVAVTTTFIPQVVYLSIQDQGTPVCGGNLSRATATTTDAGFVIYATIEADHAIVRYRAEK